MENSDHSKIFAKVPHPYGKFDEKHDDDVFEAVRPTVLELCRHRAEMGIREIKNCATKILRSDSNSATSKNTRTAVSAKKKQIR